MKIYTATNVKTGEIFEGTVKELINELGFKRHTIYGYANTWFIFNNTWKFSSTEKDTKYENTGFVDNSLWRS